MPQEHKYKNKNTRDSLLNVFQKDMLFIYNSSAVCL